MIRIWGHSKQYKINCKRQKDIAKFKTGNIP